MTRVGRVPRAAPTAIGWVVLIDGHWIGPLSSPWIDPAEGRLERLISIAPPPANRAWLLEHGDPIVAARLLAFIIDGTDELIVNVLIGDPPPARAIHLDRWLHPPSGWVEHFERAARAV